MERRLLGWINVVLTNRGFRFKENVTPISWDSSFLRYTRGATSGSITKLGTSIPARLSLAHRFPCQFHAAVIRQSCRFSFEAGLPRSGCNLENNRECHEWNSWEWNWCQVDVQHNKSSNEKSRFKETFIRFLSFLSFFTWKWLLDYKFWIVQLLKSSKKCKVLGNFLKPFESRENSRNSKNFESFDWKSWKKCKVLGNLSIEERRENSRNFELPN